MAGKIHPYYQGIQRIVDAHPDRWTISTLAKDARMNDATIRKAIDAGSAPSVASVEKIKGVLGLDYDGVINWNGEPIDSGTKADELKELARLGPKLSAADRKSILGLARSLVREQDREEGGGGED